MQVTNSIALVSGANRGIGHALVKALLARGASRVHATSRNGKLRSDIASDPRVVAHVLDITSPEQVGAVAEAASDLTLLINNAGTLSSGSLLDSDESVVLARRDLDTNLFGTLNMLRAFVPKLEGKEAGIVNFLSLSALAGAAYVGGYSASKAAGDLLVKSYVRTFGLPALIMRSSNNYGPNQYPEKVIPLFVTNLIEGKKVPLYSKGENIRDWLFVEDNARAIWLAYRLGKIGEIYNIGAGNERTNREMVSQLLKVFGKDKGWIKKVPDRPGHDYRYSVNFQKMRRLGFRPKVSFAEGLKKTIKWYQENPRWWKPLKNNRFTQK